MKRGFLKKIGALLLASAIVVSGMPKSSFPIYAQNEANDIYNLITDSESYSLWEDVLGSKVTSTANSGRIWTDKTVYNGTDEVAVSASDTIQSSDPHNFLVNLSALSSNKEIVGEAAVPVDVVFVLDMSTSMSNNNRVGGMVDALNDAMSTLLTDKRLHKDNRVGVVTYNLNDSELLPLDHYSFANGSQNQKYIEASRRGSSRYDNRIIVNENVRNSNNEAVKRSFIETDSATVIQEGIEAGARMLSEASDKDVDGVKRIPILIVMSDGVVSRAFENYVNLSGTQYRDDGNGNSLQQPITAFLTQLTGEYYKNQIEAAYGRDSLVYTLGLAVGEDGQAVLDPSGITASNEHYNALQAILRNFLNASNGDSYHTESSGSWWNPSINFNRHEDTITTNQFNDAYFAAADGSLSDAFEDIVNEIIIQSRYYPTDNETGKQNLSGYITFEDEIGRFMEVKQMRGISDGEHVHTGAAFARMIAQLETNQVTEEANSFINSLKDRIGITTQQAIELIDAAWKDDQLYYNSNSDFGNYLAWYADENGNYLGFAKKDKSNLSEYPNAMYFNRSYSVIGSSDEGYTVSDHMFITMRIEERLKATQGEEADEIVGTQKVMYMIPSALVPIVKYELTIEGDDLNSANTGKISRTLANPLRMFYEVGLRDDINEFNVTNKIENSEPEYIHKGNSAETGKYNFYSNAWYKESPRARTLVTYTPNEQNEFYVFNKNTTIYEDEGCTIKLKSKPQKNKNYYYKKAIFEFTGSTGDIKDAHANIKHSSEKILENALFGPEGTEENFAYDNEGKEWYVKIGTPKITEAQAAIEVLKDKVGGNKTGTSDYVRASEIHKLENEDENLIVVKNHLGNNGRLELQQQQGIMIEKQFDENHPNEGNETHFNFKITLLDKDKNEVSGSYPMTIFMPDGTRLEEQTIVFNNGEATLTLAENQKAYIAPIETGYTYTVSEEATKDPDYLLKDVKVAGGANYEPSTGVASGVVNEHQMGEMTFVNQYVETTQLTIVKNVVGYVAEDYEFKFTATVDGITQEFSLPNGGSKNIRVPVNAQVSVQEVGALNYMTTITTLPNGGIVNNVAKTWSGTVGAPLTITYTNTWNVSPVNFDVNTNLTALKNLTGREFNDSDNFEFVIRDESGNIVSRGTLGNNTDNDVADDSKGQKVVNFDTNLTFTTPGIYKFTVSEVRPMEGNALPGISYDAKSYNLEIVVSEVETGGLIITSQKLDGNEIGNTSSEIVFENVYQADAISPVLQVQKIINNLIGTNVSYNDFVFSAVQVDGSNNPIGSEFKGTINSSGVVTFTVPEINKEGTYTYLIREIKDSNNAAVTYDEKVIKATVVIELAENAYLRTASVTYSVDGITTTTPTFVNTVDAKDVSVNIAGTKILDGREIKDTDDFAFKAYPANANGETTGIGEDVVFSPSADNKHEGSLSWTKTFDKVGTYYYVFAEEKGNVKGITYDATKYLVQINVTHDNLASSELKATATVIKKTNAEGVFEDINEPNIKFTNIYTPEATTLDIPFTKGITSDKNIEGLDRGWLDGDRFRFLLYRSNKDFSNTEYLQNVTLTSEKGKFTVTIPAEGTYYYQLRESQQNPLPGFTNDTRKYNLTVEATADDSTGELNAKITNIQIADSEEKVEGIHFDNFYTTRPTSVILNATKVFDNQTNIVKDIQDFEFELLDANKNRVGEIVHPIANGNVSFTINGLNKVANYTYYIREIEKDDGIVYDRKEHKVNVNVSDNGKGALVASVTYDNENNTRPVFTNTLAITDTAEVALHAKKELEGRTLKANEFEFTMTESSSTGEIPENAIVLNATNDAEGNIVFDTLRFDELSHVYYVIEEVKPEEALQGITYDNTKYLVEINVTNLTKDGKVDLSKLVANTKITKLGSNEKVDAIVFRNDYTPNVVEVNTDEAGGVFAKVIKGRDWLDTDAFTFTLKTVDGAPEPEKTTNTITSEAKENKAVSFGFGKIRFTKDDMNGATLENGIRTKVFTYEVTENAYDINGMRPEVSNQVATLTVTVTDDGSGQLKAETKVSNATFINVYTPKGTEINTGTDGNGIFAKIVEGRDWLNTDEFTFTLTALNNAPLPELVGKPIKSNAKEGDVVPFGFGKIAFTAEDMKDAPLVDGVRTKVFTYEVEENDYNINGMSPKVLDQVATLTVTVTDDGSGQLKAETEVSNATFTNVYTPSNAEVDTDVAGGLFTKIIKGRDWLDTDAFTFTLKAVDGAPEPEKVEQTITSEAKENEEVSFGFGNITFTAKDMDGATLENGIRTKVFTYEVTENAYNIKGMSPKDPNQVATLTVTVTDDGKGQLKAETEVSNATFTNVYTPKGTEINTGTDADGKGIFAKVVKGRDWLDTDAFTFTLKATEGTPLPKEVEQTITSEAKENEEVSFGFGNITFTAKDMDGATLENGIRTKVFTYEVTENAYDINGMRPEVSNQVATLTVTVTDDGSGQLKAETEVSNATFTNVYTPSNAEVDTDVAGGLFTKIIKGRDWLNTDAFTFTLKAVDGAPEPEKTTNTITSEAKENEEVSFGFGNITFTAEDMKDASLVDGVRTKVFTYEVTENAYDIKGMSPRDPNQVATLIVTVTDDGKGKLQAKSEWINETFVNIYTPSNAEVDTDVAGGLFTKIIKGRDWLDTDAFTFTLKAVDGAPEPEKVEQTITSKAKEKEAVPFGFGKIRFTKDDMNGATLENGVRTKVFTYEVTENAYDIKGMRPEDPNQVATLTVTVTDDGSGVLKTTTEWDNTTFTNVYTPEGTDINTDTDADGKGLFAKIVKGRDWLNTDAFTFTLKATEGTPLPEKTTNTITSEAKENEEVSFGFGNITFTAKDMKDAPLVDGIRTKAFTYEVTENAYNIKGMSPKDPNQVATLTVTVTDDGSGQLKTDVESVNSIFTNIYVKPEIPTENPNTGDTTNRNLWTAALFISISGLGTLLYRRRKEKR